jgi:glycosidase
MRIFFLLAMSLLLLSEPLSALTITLHPKDAVVWSQMQRITGEVDTVAAPSGWLYLNGTPIQFYFPYRSNKFTVLLRLDEGTNIVVARIDRNRAPLYSDTLKLTLGYKLRPDVFAYASVSERTVTLHGTVLENPDSSGLTFFWRQDGDNPAPITFSNPADSVTSFTLPNNAPMGEYYFDLLVVAADGDSAKARTLVTVDSAGVKAFNPATDCASWIDNAIIYGLTPYIFVRNGGFQNITQKILELAQLGINTIWLQPVYQTHGGGQGYDVTDYFAVRSDLGSDAELRTLIQTAHAHGLKVLFDFVPNHTSIHHPYAQDAIRFGANSHYYDFYQHALDNAPYSRHYNVRRDGLMQFVYYFWADLPNLNYGNPEVQRMIVEAGKFWIENFDIDGYRVDAVWGVNARNPKFMQQWRLALKRLKPEILLLAEDKATWPMVFDERFDAAYDWADEESWVSHWVWQTSYSASSNPTIFNQGDQSARASLLHAALTNNDKGYHPRAKIFRFMENNDTFRFLATHDLARTKMAAALMFSLPGIPSIFNGQEIGAATHPYQTSEIFRAGASIQSLDRYGLFAYYRKLARLRKTYPALTGANWRELPVMPCGYTYAYRRWTGEQNIFSVINMGNAAVSAVAQLSLAQLHVDSSKTYYLTDLLTNEFIAGTAQTLGLLQVPVEAYTTRMFLLTDTLMATAVASNFASTAPQEFGLAQNCPNPFNPTTIIAFDLPRNGWVSLHVFDLLGRKVATLVDGKKEAGRHQVDFDGKGISSGVYFYRLRFDEASISKKMILAR